MNPTFLNRLFRLLLISSVSLGILTIPGCGGCQKDETAKQEDEKKKKKEKPKAPYEERGSNTLPTGKDALSHVKLGHWYTMRQKWRANNADFNGQMVTETMRPVASGAQGRLMPLRDMQVRLETTRPISLPKGRTRQFEVLGFAPHDPTTTAPKTVGMKTDLRTRNGRDVYPGQPGAIVMQPHQYFFVVMARDAKSYSYLGASLPSIKPPSDWNLDTDFNKDPRDFIVTFTNDKEPASLPSSSLLWTNISYVLWDDFDESQMTLQQKEAMIDWLHFGGQLIVSGPLSLDSLKNGFLADYLPAKPGGTIDATPEEFDQFKTLWAYKPREKDVGRGARKETTYQRVELELAEDAEYLPGCQDWVVEKRVGRGRIVVTSFRLTSGSPFTNFYGYDNFLNACLLRRPSRYFGNTQIPAYQTQSEAPIQWQIGNSKLNYRDARLNSNLRYFSRDAQEIPRMKNTGGYAMRGYALESGVAAWSDANLASSNARQALTSSAGITIPKASLIATMLGVYLLVLVPLNWMIFRVFDRVEWAWFAVPLIAIGGTALVVKMARLDIGFARSRTELAVLELQPGYDKGHLTRYIALYSSLATHYDMSFESGTALALPFALNRQGMADSMQTVRLRRDKGSTLSGYRVLSNDTGMVHSEEMHSVGGPIKFEKDGSRFRLTNNTDHELKGVGIFRKINGDAQFADLGDLASQKSMTFNFEPLGEATEWREKYQVPPADENSKVEISLDGLANVASDPLWLNDGDVRLIAFTDTGMKGLTITPSSSQRVFRTFVLAHLQHGKLSAPRPDVNNPPEFELAEPEIIKIDDVDESQF